MNPIKQILRKSTLEQSSKRNIISWNSHERMQQSMGNIPHTFYLLGSSIHPNYKTWNFKFGNPPPNHILLPEFHNENEIQLPTWIDFDLIISHSRTGQASLGQMFSQQLGIPLISTEHTLPLKEWNKTRFYAQANILGDINVFVTHFQMSEWGHEEDGERFFVNPSGIDEKLFCPDNNIEKEDYCLVVCNDFINRMECGFDIFCNVTNFNNSPEFKIKILGDTKNLSKPANSITELVNYYRKSRVLLNTTRRSTMPTNLLEAMAVGTVPVSTDNCSISDIITHKHDGFLSNDTKKLRKYCLELLNDDSLMQEMGKNARNTILKRFTKNKYVERWNNIIEKAIKL